MPLIKCRECERDVSSAAAACPHCGEPRPSGHLRASPQRTGIADIAVGSFLGLTIFAVIVLALALLLRGSSTATMWETDRPAEVR